MTIDAILDKLTDKEVRHLLFELGQPSLLAAWERDQQVRFALERFNQGQRLRTVAEALKRRYGLSRTTAYRRATEALSHHSRYGETPSR